MRTYNEVIFELKKIGIDDIYDYKGFDLEDTFEKFFQFCQEYLDREDLDFDIRPARIYFNNKITLNAKAKILGKYSLVEINKATLFWFREFYLLKADIFDLNSLDFYKTLMSIKPSYLLFQTALNYYFYHEVGHLIQSKNGDADYIEYTEDIFNQEEIGIRHMRELDADWFSAHCLAMHIKEFAEREVITKPDSFLDIVALSLSSLYMYFIKQNVNHSSIYYQEKTHPHPSIRLVYMVKFILENLSGNIEMELDESEIIKRTIKITDILMSKDDSNLLEQYSLGIYDSFEEIQLYISKIISDTGTYPYLSKNAFI